jgi:ABC-type transport system substrate-binding protein
MITKRFLVFTPIGIAFFLFQSLFWVPTYDRQAQKNPNRLLQYIQGSIGDAGILNPVLSADSASSQINSLVFDGLIDLDDKLNFRPRLAKSWKEYEEAFLTLDFGFEFNGATIESGDAWKTFILDKLKDNAAWFKNIEKIEILRGKKKSEEFVVKLKDKNASELKVSYSIDMPDRMKFTLKKVDQDFFKPIWEVIGENYKMDFPYSKFIKFEEKNREYFSKDKVKNILPVAEHNPVIVFDLKEGIKFHDGSEFTADDVLFTYQSIMNPINASPRRSDYEPVKRAKILGKYEIQFIYKRLFSSALNSWTMGILPDHLLNKKALKKEALQTKLAEDKVEKFSMRDSAFNREPIGTGPFIFKEWRADELIRLGKNESYWDRPPEYDEFVMRIIPDTLTQEMEFYSAAVDYYKAEPHQVSRFKKETKYHSVSSVGSSYSYIGYNLRNPLFQSAEIRVALGMAINVDEIIKYVLYGEGERVTGPFAKNTNWYDNSIKSLPYDPEGALEIFEKLGWEKNQDGYLEKDGRIFEFNLITNNGNAVRKNILTIAQNNWKKLGVKCNTQLFEWAVFLKDFVNPGKFDALVLGWQMGIDPDLFQLWHSSQTNPRQLNFVGYKNPEADRLIIRIRQEYDKGQQLKLTHALHKIIADDQPYSFLFVNKSTLLLDKKIVIVDRNESGQESYKKIYPTKDGNVKYYFNKWRKLSDVSLIPD